MECCIRKYEIGELNNLDFDRAAHAERKEYYNAVFDAMWASIKASAPAIEARLRLAFMSPGITGLPPEVSIEYLDDNGISAGPTYAFCYYAITGKKVAAKDLKIMSKLIHFQADLMNNALAELDEA